MKISFKEHTLDIDLWRTALAGLAEKVSQQLDELCYHEDFGMRLPEKIPDDWTNTDRGYSWLENADFTSDPLALLNRMIKDDSLQLASVNGDNKLEMRSASMWNFLGRSAEVNRGLALLCFFINGQNTRISEFVEHKHRNSTRPRTMMYDDHSQSIWLVTRRTKNLQETFIPLKCSPVVTGLLAKYFLVVRPVEAHIAFHVRGKEARALYREYMWVQNCELMQKSTMYNMVPEFFERTVDDRIGIHDYRQIAVEISRIFLGSELEMDQEAIDLVAAQRGHTEATARFKYASEAGHLPRLSSELLLRFGKISEKWWHVTGFKPGAAPLPPLRTRQRLLNRTADNMDFDNSGPGERLPEQMMSAFTKAMESTFHQMQSKVEKQIKDSSAKALADLESHIVRIVADSTRITEQALGKTLAGLESNLKRIVTESLADAQKDLSPRFMLSSPPPPPTSASSSNLGDHRMSPVEPVDEAADIYESNTDLVPLQTVIGTGGLPYGPTEETRGYLHHLLQLHFPDQKNPTFKSSQQMEAVELATARQENFVLVLPTGGGKSLVFTLPPFNEPDFRTYVIVPNKALLTDHVARCKKLGLPTFHWQAHCKDVPDDVRVVFLALETAATEAFRA
jgi:hypothetical protein